MWEIQSFVTCWGFLSVWRGHDSLKPIMIRFPRHILAGVDRAAKQLGISRTAFIVQSSAEKLTKLDRDGFRASPHWLVSAAF
jgi:hypothetical protein